MESAGKFPPAFLESTVTVFGDYDECLAIESKDEANVFGQYCMVDMFPVGNNEDQYRGKEIYLKSIPLFKGTGFLVGVCFPANCTSNEVRVLTSEGVLALQHFSNCNCDIFQPCPSFRYF